MKLKTDIGIGHKTYRKGSHLPWFRVYGLFLFTIAAIFWVVFDIIYLQRDSDLGFVLFFGLFIPALYLLAYRSIFGITEVRWLIINSAIGIIGIITELDWVLSYLYDKNLSDFPIYYHIIPCAHYILLTFVLRQAVIDTFNSRDNKARRKYVNLGFVLVTLTVYITFYFID